jgi:hypothetical protein
MVLTMMLLLLLLPCACQDLSAKPPPSSCRAGAVVHLQHANNSKVPVTLQLSQHDDGEHMQHVIKVRGEEGRHVCMPTAARWCYFCVVAAGLACCSNACSTPSGEGEAYVPAKPLLAIPCCCCYTCFLFQRMQHAYKEEDYAG